jgi:hypothetical protein
VKGLDWTQIQFFVTFSTFCIFLYWMEHGIEVAKRIEFFLRLEVMRGQQAVNVAKEYEDIDKAKNAFLANV